MTNILKQSEGLVTALKRNKFQYATLKLTAFYVLSTAVILLVSSLAVLIIFSPGESYDSFLRDGKNSHEEVEHDEFSLYEVRENLPLVIATVDLFVLAVVSFLAYFFARQTLLPIKEMHENQQRFMSDVAHELRTPLAVLSSGAEATLRKTREVKEYEDFIGDVRDEVGRLTRLTNQLLEMLRLGQVENLRFEKINLSDLVLSVVGNFVPYAEDKQVAVKAFVIKDLFIETVADGLIEVLQNLLKNATDYNKKNGSVEVRVEEMEKTFLIKISDTGIGIPPDKIETVFGRFVKVDEARTQNNVSGTGLGLAIVENLVNQLGGTISIESELNKGTEVTVTLPKLHS